MKHVHVIEKSGTLVRKYKDASSDLSETYSISVLMICVLASSAVDRGRVKTKMIKLVFAASPPRTQH